MFVVDRLSESNKIIRNYKEDLKLYGRLRNAIIHNPFAAKIETIAEPHPEIVKKYAWLRDEIMNPPTALSAAIGAKRIYSTSIEANAREVMEVMEKRLFSYVPVLDVQGRMVGIFSENTVFLYLIRNEICAIDGKTKIGEFGEFIPMNQHVNEHFQFVGRNTTLTHVKDLFEKGLVERKRLGAVYVTENGNPDESLLGMITAWDIAGNK
jgi:CBS domain-containing protein